MVAAETEVAVATTAAESSSDVCLFWISAREEFIFSSCPVKQGHTRGNNAAATRKQSINVFVNPPHRDMFSHFLPLNNKCCCLPVVRALFLQNK